MPKKPTLKKLNLILGTILAGACLSAGCLGGEVIPVETLPIQNTLAINTEIVPTETTIVAPTQITSPSPTIDQTRTFSGERALKDVKLQVSWGARIPGSSAHQQVIEWIQKELQANGWRASIQEEERLGHPIINVIGQRGNGNPWTILGAHYDSRLLADQDPDPEKRSQPVPGANDGASGVAVLLELSRVIPKELEEKIWLVFFDAEDNGNIPGWDWILGSQAFVDSLEQVPDRAVIVDMVGDADLKLYIEQNSTQEMAVEIWNTAQRLGYPQFIPQAKYTILDDHLPFLQAGIPAVDIIDIEYPYWHTTQDTADKVSAVSLEAVGETLLTWLLGRN